MVSRTTEVMQRMKSVQRQWEMEYLHCKQASEHAEQNLLAASNSYNLIGFINKYKNEVDPDTRDDYLFEIKRYYLKLIYYRTDSFSSHIIAAMLKYSFEKKMLPAEKLKNICKLDDTLLSDSQKLIYKIIFIIINNKDKANDYIEEVNALRSKGKENFSLTISVLEMKYSTWSIDDAFKYLFLVVIYSEIAGLLTNHTFVDRALKIIKENGYTIENRYKEILTQGYSTIGLNEKQKANLIRCFENLDKIRLGCDDASSCEETFSAFDELSQFKSSGRANVTGELGVSIRDAVAVSIPELVWLKGDGLNRNQIALEQGKNYYKVAEEKEKVDERMVGKLKDLKVYVGRAYNRYYSNKAQQERKSSFKKLFYRLHEQKDDNIAKNWECHSKCVNGLYYASVQLAHPRF